jgi:peptidase M48-like protein
LTRDQLQGVIAHEFSHVLNGDMRLNIRMIGVLHGVLLLGLLGRILLHSSAHSRGSSRNNGVAAILVVGLAMLILGFIGTLMGNLIKAAVSRQREYLADASAVQFTRNPGGITGALKRIGAAMVGSKIQHAGASELSHMYFAQGVWEGFSGLMATHPPLPKRIQRLDPQWDGKYPERSAAPVAVAAPMEAAPMAAGLVGAAVLSGRPSTERVRASERVRVEAVEHASDQIGDPTEKHRLYAAALVKALPAPVRLAVREPYGARAVLFALLLDKDSQIRNVQMETLVRNAAPDVVALTRQLAPDIDQLDIRARLPLVDLALPSLRAMAQSQYLVFSQCFHQLVRADQRLGLFEWTLYQILMRHLHPQFERVRRPFVQYFALKRLGQPCSVLFSAIAYAGHGQEQAQAALAVAAGHLPEVPIELLVPEECGMQQLDGALKQLVRVSVKQRRRLIDAAAGSICSDARVEVREAELLRAISDMLDCPMPPLLPGQPVASR